VENLLVIGCGDVARRALPQLQKRYRVRALVRDFDPSLRAAGVAMLRGDLDDADALLALARSSELGADRVLHCAPPADIGCTDLRTRSLIAALEAFAPPPGARMVPQRFVYLSTSGVYGDCRGDFVDETRAPRPRTDRARRRLDAEGALSDWGGRHGADIVLLRAPGIYASDRLPLQRLRQNAPALLPEEDVYSNHIHAEDLAAAIVAALERVGANGAYNASDDSQMKMGDYFDLVADRAGLPRPPRMTRAEAARRLSPAQLTFLDESRRLVNRRMKEELGVRLRFPTVADGIPNLTVA
jgi:nucleoside-diphosphate-sugar epimerase